SGNSAGRSVRTASPSRTTTVCPCSSSIRSSSPTRRYHGARSGRRGTAVIVRRCPARGNRTSSSRSAPLRTTPPGDRGSTPAGRAAPLSARRTSVAAVDAAAARAAAAADDGGEEVTAPTAYGCREVEQVVRQLCEHHVLLCCLSSQ